MKKFIYYSLIFTFVCISCSIVFGSLSGKNHLLDVLAAATVQQESGTYSHQSFPVNDQTTEINLTAVKSDLIFQSTEDDEVRVNFPSNYTWGRSFEDFRVNQLFHLDFSNSEIDSVKPHVSLFKNFQLSFSLNNSNIIVFVPRTIKSINVQTVSGDVRVRDLNLDRLRVSTTSGDFETNQVSIQDVQYDTISGDSLLEGKLSRLKAKTTSGDLKISTSKDNPQFNMQTVSGDVKIIFSEPANVTVNYKTMTGDIKMRNPNLNADVEGNVKEQKLGTGIGQINIETVSGDAKVEYSQDELSENSDDKKTE
jgi:DUF4097 and DUF4098 domain-containing protein YvlB